MHLPAILSVLHPICKRPGMSAFCGSRCNSTSRPLPPHRADPPLPLEPVAWSCAARPASASAHLTPRGGVARRLCGSPCGSPPTAQHNGIPYERPPAKRRGGALRQTLRSPVGTAIKTPLSGVARRGGDCGGGAWRRRRRGGAPSSGAEQEQAVRGAARRRLRSPQATGARSYGPLARAFWPTSTALRELGCWIPRAIT